MGISSVPGLGDAFLPLAFLPLFLLKDGVNWILLQVMGNHQDTIEVASAMPVASMRHQRQQPGQQGEEEWCCSVCLQGLENGREEVSQIVACNHLFHRACLERWLLVGMGSTCPLCRSTLH
ncbi:E3 ubiquitin-protein ligase RNF149-like [Dendrobium catenatum]|uniref:E3 ubiquitin-protein ligase RNF149-like n=1 Tax=Dendrobium catenatum TaxID=906689 RepID=UPI0009F53452|nr:E3 ubiquitin-protein ligase RNF149-like [Dendrobium catenatum]